MKRPNYKILFWIGMLCFLGSFINSMGIMKYSIPISHVTGNLVKGISLVAKGKISTQMFTLIAVGSFFSGAFISGFVFSSRVFSFGKRYGLYLIGLGCILAVSTFFFHEEKFFLFILSLITGMQNGMFVSYKGSTCRTTHLTGTMTDFATLLGNVVAGNHDNDYKLHYYLINISSALAGMITGFFTYSRIGDSGFFISSFFYLLAGLTYFITRKYVQSTQLNNPIVL